MRSAMCGRCVRKRPSCSIRKRPRSFPGLTVFVLHAADGTPLCITDSFEEATRDARGNQLEPVRVH